MANQGIFGMMGNPLSQQSEFGQQFEGKINPIRHYT